MAFFSLQSANFPDRYIRHQSFLGELTQIQSDLDRQDATFDIQQFGDKVRLVASNFPGMALRHQDFRIKLDNLIVVGPPGGFGDADTPENRLAEADETFTQVPGLADPSAVSFRSLNFPDRFIRHRDFHLFLEAADSDLARQDATFFLREPFAPPPSPVVG